MIAVWGSVVGGSPTRLWESFFLRTMPIEGRGQSVIDVAQMLHLSELLSSCAFLQKSLLQEIHQPSSSQRGPAASPLQLLPGHDAASPPSAPPPPLASPGLPQPPLIMMPAVATMVETPDGCSVPPELEMAAPPPLEHVFAASPLLLPEPLPPSEPSEVLDTTPSEAAPDELDRVLMRLSAEFEVGAAGASATFESGGGSSSGGEEQHGSLIPLLHRGGEAESSGRGVMVSERGQAAWGVAAVAAAVAALLPPRSPQSSPRERSGGRPRAARPWEGPAPAAAGAAPHEERNNNSERASPLSWCGSPAEAEASAV